MSTTTISITMKPLDRLKDVLCKGLIPNNSNLDKGRPGNGMTYAEITADRWSIIPMPNLNAILDKHQWCIANGYSSFPIYENVNKDNLKGYLLLDIDNKNILVTPESFPVLMNVAKELGLQNSTYKQFFCLLDESHCYASEAFRRSILNPFIYFFKFRHKAMGSATPYPHSDPRIERLQKYVCEYDEPIGHVKIIHCDSPQETLCHFIKEHPFPGNVHIFFNSVTACGDVIRTTGITDVNIYCVDNERNEMVLHDSVKYLKSQPLKAEQAKFNSYTCRYAESWDCMDDESATMIFVTDKKIPHSLLGIKYKGVQCLGRLRDVKPHEIFHITNTFDIPANEVQTFEQVHQSCKYEALHQVKSYNELAMGAKDKGIMLRKGAGLFIKEYSYFNKLGVAMLYDLKLDQIVYAEYCKQNYSTIDTVEACWIEGHYTTSLHRADLPAIEVKGVTKADKNKQIYHIIIDMRTNPDKYQYGNARKSFESFKDRYNVLYHASTKLTQERMEELNYEDQLMKEELINISNECARIKMIPELIKRFKVNVKYSRKHIKQILQDLYEQYEVRNSRGKIKAANASQLYGFKLFKLKEDKMDKIDGKRDAAFLIEGTTFVLIKAA